MPSALRSAPPARYTVYVVELRPRREGRAPRVCDVYVGSTHLSAPDRFREHKRGPRGSRHVRKYGIRLRPDLLAETATYATRGAAQAAETAAAKRLSRRGHRVFGSCSPSQSSCWIQ